MTHTPGPWIIVGQRIEYNLPCPSGDVPMGGAVAAYVADAFGNPIAPANMRLIAAAPDLLAALKTLVIGCESAGHESGIAWALEQARAAIDNATRETS